MVNGKAASAVCLAAFLTCILTGTLSPTPPLTDETGEFEQPFTIYENPNPQNFNPNYNPFQKETNIMVDAVGKLVIYYNWPLWDGSNVPTAAAVRIGEACQVYGNPAVMVVGNGADRTTYGIYIYNAFIDAMHAYGIKVYMHGHSYGNYAVDDPLRLSLAHVKAQMDRTILYGSHIDGWEMDETDPTGSVANIAYYTELRNYWRTISGDKPFNANFGGRDMSDGMLALCDEWANTESTYWYFSQNGGLLVDPEKDFHLHALPLIATYPEKFMGLISNWYINTRNNPLSPNYAPYIMSPTYGRTYPITEAQAVNLVKEAWNNGIYYFGVLWDDPPNAIPPTGYCNGFPTYWESFIGSLPMAAPIATATITASAGANGAITPTGATDVNVGSSQTYTYAPDSGYMIDTVTVDGVSVGRPNTYTFTNVSAPHTIHVTFMVLIYELSDTIDGTANTSEALNELHLFPITASQSGTLSSIGLNLSEAAGNIRFGIYSTYSGGACSTLLGESASTAAVAGWNNLSIPGPVAITQGVTYYVGYQNSTYNCVVYGLTGASTHLYKTFSYDAFPDPTGALSSELWGANIRINYVAATAPANTVTDYIGAAGNNVEPYGVLHGFPLTLSDTGTLLSIGVNLAVPYGNIRVGAYSTYSGGVFSGLLGESASTPAVVGWNDLTIAGSVALTAATTIYLVFQCDSWTCTVYGANNTGTHYYRTFTYAAFPDPTGAVSSEPWCASMRVTYVLPGAPAVTPGNIAVLVQKLLFGE